MPTFKGKCLVLSMLIYVEDLRRVYGEKGFTTPTFRSSSTYFSLAFFCCYMKLNKRQIYGPQQHASCYCRALALAEVDSGAFSSLEHSMESSLEQSMESSMEHHGDSVMGIVVGTLLTATTLALLSVLGE